MTLPVEIILLILENSYYLQASEYHNRPNLLLDRKPDYKTLAACSRINSEWRAPAQILLFNHVVDHAAPRLAHLTKSFLEGPPAVVLRWKELLKNVKILDILLSQYKFVGPSGIPGKPCCGTAEFMMLMKYCPQLYELSLRATGIISLDAIPADLRIPPALYPSQLRALRLMQCSVQSPILYELLALFPTVQFLTIGVEIVSAPPPDTAPSVQLYEIVMFRVLSTPIVSWLMSGSRQSLRVVELRDLPSRGVSQILQEHGPNLQSLRVMRYNVSTARVLHACTNLQELVVLGLPSIPPIDSLPSTLEHFSFVHRHSDGTGLEDLVHALRSLHNMKVVSCDSMLWQDQRLLKFISDVCEEKGIELQGSKYGFWPNEEPVKVSRFPRRRSTSNFRSMNQVF